MDQILYDPDRFIQMAIAYRDEKKARQALEEKALLDAPKVLFADSVSACSQSILVGALAKLLRQNGVQIGQNRLFEQLRTRQTLEHANTAGDGNGPFPNR